MPTESDKFHAEIARWSLWGNCGLAFIAAALVFMGLAGTLAISI